MMVIVQMGVGRFLRGNSFLIALHHDMWRLVVDPTVHRLSFYMSEADKQRRRRKSLFFYYYFGL
jgi:hypothetical protein